MRWLRRLFDKSRSENHLEKELRFHIEQQIADSIAAGVSLEEARRRANLEFGGLERVKEEVRDTRWETHLDNLLRDFRYALRSLRKDRRFTFIAIFALALGIGATTVMFSVVYNLLFDPFPYKGAERLMVVNIHDLEQGSAREIRDFSIPDFLEYQKQNHVFEAMVGSNNVNVLYSDGQGTRQWWGAYVTANSFDFYGVPPIFGRGITPEDGTPNAPPVFTMNYKLWKAEFNGDPAILGKSFKLNGKLRTLVGIMPPRFQAYGA